MQAVLIAEQYLWVNYVKCRKREKKKKSPPADISRAR